MYKVYFRQAIRMLKQNRFISVIAILGTALAIMMIMTIIVVNEVKNINVAPESNRDRTFYVSYEVRRDTARGGMNSGYIRKDLVTDYLSKLKTPEVVSAYSTPDDYIHAIVGRDERAESIDVSLRATDDGFWKIFDFDFTAGAPFTREEFASGMPVAVISESTAKQLFQREESPVGKTIRIDFNPYRVVGVVRDVSLVFPKAYGEIWVPYTAKEPYGFEVALLARNLNDFPAIFEEVKSIEKRFDAVSAPKVLNLRGPENHQIQAMGLRGTYDKDMEKAVKIQNRKMVLILLVLILVPAINLSSFSMSRMKKRMAEIGIRKAFGAKRHTILIQVLYENMVTSLIGGAIGLIFSYFVVLFFRHWLLDVPAEYSIPVNMLVSIPVFIAVFIVCLLINLLSAGLPAYRASRMNIVDSLTQNDRSL